VYDDIDYLNNSDYFNKNKEKYKEYMIEWKKNNPDKVEAYNAKKRKSRGQE
jgi:hypothetical protein